MVKKILKKRSPKIGLPPGTLVYIGTRKVEEVKISVIDYDAQQVTSKEIASIEEAFPFRETPTVTWLDIVGLHETALLEKLGAQFDIHPLVLEDILNTDQRPKIEIFDDYIFIVIKMISYNESKREIESEQISIILGQNFVITFQEREGDVFQPVRTRIMNNKGRIRKRGSDYLTYALMDSIVDHYFFVLEKIGDWIESLEDQVFLNPAMEFVNDIHNLKRELLYLRRAVWPLREVINVLIREENPLIQTTTLPFLRDLYDHIIQVVDTVETFRDMVAGILDIYLSSMSNRMNEIMKVLTIIATIFIPLTFIAGVYGMNFEYMPELKWRWGYFAVWGIFIILGTSLLLFFRKKRWL